MRSERRLSCSLFLLVHKVEGVIIDPRPHTQIRGTSIGTLSSVRACGLARTSHCCDLFLFFPSCMSILCVSICVYDFLLV